LPHIFDSFFTTESSTGTGVGLAFSKMVMQSHQGKIECASVEGEYTEFILSFSHLDSKEHCV
jgi:signal transduction histidine kinase